MKINMQLITKMISMMIIKTIESNLMSMITKNKVLKLRISISRTLQLILMKINLLAVQINKP